MNKNVSKQFIELVDIVKKLRAPGGCPWDREQTPKSVAPYVIEESHELVEAINSGNKAHTCEELGDVLLQVVLQAQMFAEAGDFTITDVIKGISQKLVRRHPHVFGGSKVKNSKEVLVNWEKIKSDEKKEKKHSILDSMPRSLPALLMAHRASEKTARVGFDWKTSEGVINKIEEEARELHEAISSKDKSEIEHEYGDLIFALANLGRFLKLDPENTLRQANMRFIARFQEMEKEIHKKGLSVHSITFEEWDQMWNRAKCLLKRKRKGAERGLQTRKK